MSTRSVIATGSVDKFSGVYHHWDGYPSGVGKCILKLYRGHFKRNFAEMVQCLITERLANKEYWTTIWADWSLPISKTASGCSDGNPALNDGEGEVCNENACGVGCEYAYVLTDDKKMHILVAKRVTGKRMIGMFGSGDPSAVWEPIAVVDLESDVEPDWDALDSVGN